MTSLPEKLMPMRQGLPSGRDEILSEASFAKASLARAWHSLELASAEASILGGASAARLFAFKAADAERLAGKLSNSGAGSRLLLDAAVLLLAMGSRLNRSAWARRLASPLLKAALDFLAVNPGGDDALGAAERAAAALIGPLSSQIHRARWPGGRDLPTRRAALAHEQLASTRQPRCLRGSSWRLAGHSPTKELWIFRLGAHRQVLLFGTEPLTWSLEGLALTETLPELSSNTSMLLF